MIVAASYLCSNQNNHEAKLLQLSQKNHKMLLEMCGRCNGFLIVFSSSFEFPAR